MTASAQKQGQQGGHPVMRSRLQQVIGEQAQLPERIPSIFQFIVRSAVAMNACMLLISLGMAYLLVSILVEGPLTTMAKEHMRHRVEVMVTAIEALVPPGTVFGPQMDPVLQERITRLIRQGKQNNDSVYFILFQIDGRVIGQGIEPENPGKNRRYATDADGVHHILLLSEAAKRGGGFVQYKWYKPDGRGPYQKIAYAKMLTGRQWWIASGVYLDDIAKVREEILSTQGWYLLGVSVVLFTFLSVGYRFGSNLGHEIVQPVVEQMKGLARLADEERGSFSGVLHTLAGNLTRRLPLKLSKMARAEDATTRQKILKEVVASIELFDQRAQRLERDIFPRVVLRHGVATALKYSVEELSEDPEFPEIDVDIDESLCRSDEGRESALYLVAQGLLQNVLKHAEATQARIALTSLANNVTLTVIDNGKGFDVDSVLHQAPTAHKRFGTPWMHAIVELYGGARPEITSIPGQGTTVRITMPWSRQSETERVL